MKIFITKGVAPNGKLNYTIGNGEDVKRSIAKVLRTVFVELDEEDVLIMQQMIDDGEKDALIETLEDLLNTDPLTTHEC